MVNSVAIAGVTVEAVDGDANSRCMHWHSARDIVALRFHCCGRWFACFDCHAALAGHSVTDVDGNLLAACSGHRVWPPGSGSERAVLCGACGYVLTVDEYLNCNDACPACAAAFNPGCRLHRHLYFST